MCVYRRRSRLCWRCCVDACASSPYSVLQAAAERIDCTDFESQLGAGHRSSAATSASATAASVDEIDRLNRSAKQHVEKIRFGPLLVFIHISQFICYRTLEMDLSKSNQELAMLKLQNGWSCGSRFFRFPSIDSHLRQQRAPKNSGTTKIREPIQISSGATRGVAYMCDSILTAFE